MEKLDIDSLEFGDIVIPRKPNCHIDGHMYGPYIVVKITPEITYLIYGTSKHHGNNLQWFYINGGEHNLQNKIGYFYLKIKKICRGNIVAVVSSLNEQEKEYLKRKLYIKNQSYKDLDKLDILKEVKGY